MGKGKRSDTYWTESWHFLLHGGWWKPSSEWFGPLLGYLIILGPALWFGPWLPFTDIVAFAALNSFPPSMSYGPDHYYVLETTFIVVTMLSRIATNLSITVGQQVLLYYLAHALSYFTIIWFLLRRFVPNVFYRNTAIVIGALAYWDGQLLWGGPTAFSLGAVFAAWAAYWMILEADKSQPNRWGLILLLSILAVMSHPFVLPFVVLLHLVRLALNSHRRVSSIVALIILLVIKYMIRAESPEVVEGPILSRLFDWYPSELPERLLDLFLWNRGTTPLLFGVDPFSLCAYYYLLAGLHLIGFVLSPVALWAAWRRPTLRFFFALGTLSTVVFFWSKQDNDLIWWWPQRILTIYCCITYLTAIVAPMVIWERMEQWRPQWRFSFNRGLLVLNYSIMILVCLLMVHAQVVIFPLGRHVPEIYAELKQQILDQKIENVQLQLTGMDLSPWFLRSASFLLFSDKDLIARKVFIFTEWHYQGRNPSRLNPYTPLKKLTFAIGKRMAPSALLPGQNPILQPPAPPQQDLLSAPLPLK